MSSQRRDSAISRWVAAGGKLNASYMYRLKHQKLYPYIVADVESEISVIGIMYFLGALLCLGGIFYAIVDMFGGVALSHDSAEAFYPTQTAFVLTATVAAQIGQPIPTLNNADLAALVEPVGVREIAKPFDVLEPENTLTPTVAPTATTTPTSTPTETPTSTPSPTLTPFPFFDRGGFTVTAVQVRIAYFFPPLGASHCPESGQCDKQLLASGDEWLFKLGVGAACPPEFPMWSWVEVPQVGNYQCLQRLPLAACDYSEVVCNVLVLSKSAVVEDWKRVYQGNLWISENAPIGARGGRENPFGRSD